MRGRAIWVATSGATLLLLVVSGVAAPALGLGAAPSAGAEVHHALKACGGSDWTTYLGSTSRQGIAAKDTSLTPRSAPNLTELWNYTTGGDVSGSAAISNGVVYAGSDDGYEYALTAATGHLRWKSNLGIDHSPHPIGVSSSPTVFAGVVYVGGGNDSGTAPLDALSTSNGSLLWNVSTGPTSLGYYAWSSPLVVKGSLYMGIASRGDNPLVVGGLLEISLATHRVTHYFNTTSLSTIGASIWTSPSYDPTNGRVYVSTGNPGPNGSVWGNSVLGFSAANLRLLEHWTIPANQSIWDGDFGGTPTTFTDSNGTPLVVTSNKNGWVYAFAAGHVTAGPVWSRNISNAGQLNSSTPNLGPTAWSPGVVYVGSSSTIIGGVTYRGAIRALNDSTGQLLWQKPEFGPVLGAPAYADGALVVDSGRSLEVLNATDGHTLFLYNISGAIQGPPAIAHGEIVIGTTTGKIYGFGVAGCRAGAPPRSPAGPEPPGVRLLARGRVD